MLEGVKRCSKARSLKNQSQAEFWRLDLQIMFPRWFQGE